MPVNRHMVLNLGHLFFHFTKAAWQDAIKKRVPRGTFYRANELPTVAQQHNFDGMNAS
jgi:hypothetical protein